jgi:hypothetical protein
MLENPSLSVLWKPRGGCGLRIPPPTLLCYVSVMEISVDIYYLQTILGRLEQQYKIMADVFGPPVVVVQGPAFSFRYSNPKESDSLLCFLKGVKLVSTLNAALVLLHHGYVHEVAALCRMADDFVNEIMFIIQPLNEDKLSKDQERFLIEFFQEEFEDIEDPLGTGKKRDNVPRRKIFAAFGQIVSELNPSDAQNVAMTINRTLSGYIHGAYPQIMELCDENTPQFHMSGMPGTPREDEWREQLIIYIHRSIMASELISRKLGLKEVENHIRAFRIEYETKLDCLPELDVEALIRKIKK